MRESLFAPLFKWHRPAPGWPPPFIATRTLETDRGPATWRVEQGRVVLVQDDGAQETGPPAPLVMFDGTSPFPPIVMVDNTLPLPPLVVVEGNVNTVVEAPTPPPEHEPMRVHRLPQALANLARRPDPYNGLPALVEQLGFLTRAQADAVVTWAGETRTVGSGSGAVFEMPLEARSPSGRVLYAEPAILWIATAEAVVRVLDGIAACRQRYGQRMGRQERVERWVRLHEEVSRHIDLTHTKVLISPGPGPRDPSGVLFRPTRLDGAVWCAIARYLLAGGVVAGRRVCARPGCGNVVKGARASKRYCSDRCRTLAYEQRHREERTAEQRVRRQRARGEETDD